MYRSALHLRCCQSRFCPSYIRRLSSASTVPVANSDRESLESLEPWQDSDGKVLAKSVKDAKNIVIGDLSATLEAHRASNRAAVIRKVDTSAIHSGEPMKRLSLGGSNGGGSEFRGVQEGKEKERYQTWPADSVQAKEKYGKTGSRGFVKRHDPLEYTGAPQPLKNSWKIPRGHKDEGIQRPWLAYTETMSEDKLERLTNEIKAYEAYMRLSPREEAASELVISDVNSVARNEPQIKPLTLLGSRSTGLATPISDFDFTFTLPIPLQGGWVISPSEDSLTQTHSQYKENKLKALKALRKMERLFRCSGKFSDIELVRYARVPIIRCKHIATGLDIQIQTMVPYQSAYEHIIAYLSEFPSLRPLYIILRYCLELRDLTTVFEGGLGSYSILMMIVTALKHSSGKFASEDLGGQLLHVLEFYGKANLYKVGFSADPPRVFDKQQKGLSMEKTFYPRKPYLLCLQDPANALNDLGKNAYAIKHIQATFNHAKKTIQAALEEKNENSKDRTEGETWSYLDQLVRADYSAFESYRSRIEQCATPERLRDRESASEAFDGNEAESSKAGDSLTDKTRLANDTMAWYDKQLVRNDRIERARRKAIAKAKEEKLQKLHGTNDDEYGWKPSSPSNRDTVLEAIAVPKSALAARTAPSKRVSLARTRNQDNSK